MPPAEPEERVRLDRWLWAARFYKTRSLAAAAIAGGKVQLQGQRVKRSKLVQVGDEVRMRKGPFEQTVIIRALSERRGPPAEAAALYEETVESIRARERRSTEMHVQPSFDFKTKGRPTKKERREIDRWKRSR